MAGKGGPKSREFGIVRKGTDIPCPRCNGTGKIPPASVSIGDRVRALRSHAGELQEQTSIKLQISRGQLANIEGDRSRPGIELLVSLANHFGVSVDYLLGRQA